MQNGAVSQLIVAEVAQDVGSSHSHPNTVVVAALSS